MKIRPLSDRILLKPIKPENVTKSGIVLPESANKERPQMYEVVAKGPGKEVDGKFTQIDVNVGDKVISGQYSGDDIKIDGEDYKMVGYDYILGVVEE